MIKWPPRKSRRSDQLHENAVDFSQLSATPRKSTSSCAHSRVHKRVLRMVALRQDKNGNFSARKQLPDDVREEYGQAPGDEGLASFLQGLAWLTME
jgi:hypothetical protein